MADSGRLFLCARCRAQVIVCRRCDSARTYCSPECADDARRASLRTAAVRYQRSMRGRMRHAARQRRYRQRQKEKAHRRYAADAADTPLAASVSTTSASAPPIPSAGAHPCEQCDCCGHAGRVARAGALPLQRAARRHRCRHCQKKVTHHPCSPPAADALLGPTSATAANPAGTIAGASRASGQCHFCRRTCEFVRHGPLRHRVIRPLRTTTGTRGFDP